MSNIPTETTNLDLFAEQEPSNGTNYDSAYDQTTPVFQTEDRPGVAELFGVEEDKKLIDGLARFEAINPFSSFIVQAPAGSGKTALLTQRFLALLSQVDQPEQIVAMTFTKKAAAEMRDRIMGALKMGLLTELPENATLNDFNTWQLAKSALQQNNHQAWSLLQNPNRLRIKTIDGLNSYLVGQMPLLSKMGAPSQISHKVDSSYKEAVHLTLKTPELEEAVARLLGLVNGRFNRAESLLMNMLKKRDQWMGNLLRLNGDDSRANLESALETIVLDELKQQVAMLSHVRPLLEEACQVAEYAVQKDQPELDILCGAWPLSDSLSDIQAWQRLADWLITKDSKGIRKTVTKNNGFPAGKGEAKERKDQFLNVLAGLREGNQSKDVLDALAILKELPEPHYSDDQWLDLQWLIQLLRVSSAYLKVVFQSSGQADFIEIAQAASQALGHELEPTDLAQQLDYQVKHLLVDEFQDTSSEQFSLIRKLIAGWQPGDGRTLFIVGDPMQSIYRFREAEVGNFLKVWQGKVGSVNLTPLNLKVNFRSSQGVVDWVNQNFSKVLPKANNIEKGAVSYSDSVAFSTDTMPAVHSFWAVNRSHEEEAEEIVALIQQRLSELNEGDGKSIALLGRSRSSLMGIARLLKQAGIGFRAVDLEALNERQEVQDSLALSRALLHLSDRAAWIALLRSPLVGLSLNDLFAVMGNWPYQSVWSCLTYPISALDKGSHPKSANDQAWSLQQILAEKQLSEEGLQRLVHVIPILQQTLSRLGSLPFSTLVRECWIQLDGPQTVETHLALENVEVFCHTLAEFDGEVLDFQQLETMMDALFARADSSPESQRIELMTMHKSKGLEFDSVILPGLGRKPRGDDTELVSWFQFMADETESEILGESAEKLVIAPITQKGQGVSKLSLLLKRFELEKQNYELGRLLYVAATRAKQKLYLFGQINVKEPEDIDVVINPVRGSMLEALWPCVNLTFTKLLHEHEFVELDQSQQKSPWPKVSRLPLLRAGFSTLFQPEADLVKSEDEIARTSATASISTDIDTGTAKTANVTEATSDKTSPEVDTLFASRQALLNTSVGNLVHAVLEQMVDEGIEVWDATRLTQRLPFYKQWLGQQGLKERELDEALHRTEHSLANAIGNPQLRWALGSSFVESQTEQPLTALEEGGLVSNHIIDRTFVDETGLRWIVDYKTSIHQGKVDDKKGLERFIQQQVEHYQPQLERYGRLFAELEDRPQKWVLYFSYIDQWVELN
ncbi:UvrD-helicase domain-containing protein [Thiomicrorhabdus arctica]|uniref:UvrD-helicase domain-containing protein n=1 Tax=Thiomicrorhabdus arctica TaxID=131540 RepID=UPI00036FC160|nr:UvrD-helicase domain-containing protein [Thiomicrorhabdus arctica]